MAIKSLSLSLSPLLLLLLLPFSLLTTSISSSSLSDHVSKVEENQRHLLQLSGISSELLPLLHDNVLSHFKSVKSISKLLQQAHNKLSKPSKDPYMIRLNAAFGCISLARHVATELNSTFENLQGLNGNRAAFEGSVIEQAEGALSKFKACVNGLVLRKGAPVTGYTILFKTLLEFKRAAEGAYSYVNNESMVPSGQTNKSP